MIFKQFLFKRKYISIGWNILYIIGSSTLLLGSYCAAKFMFKFLHVHFQAIMKSLISLFQLCLIRVEAKLCWAVGPYEQG